MEEPKTATIDVSLCWDSSIHTYMWHANWWSRWLSTTSMHVFHKWNNLVEAHCYGKGMAGQFFLSEHLAIKQGKVRHFDRKCLHQLQREGLRETLVTFHTVYALQTILRAKHFSVCYCLYLCYRMKDWCITGCIAKECTCSHALHILHIIVCPHLCFKHNL